MDAEPGTEGHSLMNGRNIIWLTGCNYSSRLSDCRGRHWQLSSPIGPSPFSQCEHSHVYDDENDKWQVESPKRRIQSESDVICSRKKNSRLERTLRGESEQTGFVNPLEVIFSYIFKRHIHFQLYISINGSTRAMIGHFNPGALLARPAAATCSDVFDPAQDEEKNLL